MVSCADPLDKGTGGANIRNKMRKYCDLLNMRNGFMKPQRQTYKLI